MTSNPQWWAEFERQEALDMERREIARARLAEWHAYCAKIAAEQAKAPPIRRKLTSPAPG